MRGAQLALLACMACGYPPLSTLNPDGAVGDGVAGDGSAEPTAPKEIVSLSFLASNNPGLTQDVVGSILGTWIGAPMPFGTDRSALVPTFTTTGSHVEVAGVTQQSGVTANDFSAPVTYRVVADDGSTADYTIVVAPRAQQAYVKASNAGGAFGHSIAMSADGTILVVGASQESSSASGINGVQTDYTAPGSGAVYVFTRVGTTWAQQAYIKASFNSAYSYFGGSVALSSDGTLLAVGASGEHNSATGINGDQIAGVAANSGAVYVFTRSGSQWAQEAYIKASNAEANDEFGGDIALSGAGDTLAVGARFEDSGALTINGDQSDNSASNMGAAYVFRRSGGTWAQEAYLKSWNSQLGSGEKQFGGPLALSFDGNTLAVAAPSEGRLPGYYYTRTGIVYLFKRTGNAWAQDIDLKPPSVAYFGGSVALSAGGNTLVTSATGVITVQGIESPHIDVTGCGTVYVYTRSSTTWTGAAHQPVTCDNQDWFGRSAAISADGTTVVVGATSEDSAATGAGGNPNDNSKPDAGAAYVFTLSPWTEQVYLKASNTSAQQIFGVGTAISSDGATIAVGASLEASGATGIDGDQFNYDAPDSGAVYVFH